MGYIEKTLAPGETLYRRASLHWSLWIAAWAWLIFLGVFVIGVVMFLRDWIRIGATEIALTNQRLIYKTGLAARHTREVELTSVESVAVDQNLMGRLFGAGYVTVHGTGEDLWRTPLIADPLGFRRDLEAMLGQVRGAVSARTGETGQHR